MTTQVDAPLVVNLPMTAIDPSLINHAPVIEALPPIKAVAGKTTKIKVVASDKDGDNLTYSIVNSPDWISIENNVISITPSSEHAGKYTFKVKVSDGALTTQVDAPLVVNLPMTAIDPSLINHAPVIEALPPIKAVAGKTTKIKVVASDKDGDNLTYSIVNSPDWMSIENDVISITPSSEHA
ncbi:Ig-like domain-containing protein [Vibrio harveyi]|uniref:Ig-like domain-containing protein n=1 Tax=Vibrio harveyi TaxID=669 RepID=UPI002380A3B7|nr:Ig-like domain-containing protein [Vibrio harveyi]